MLTLAELAYPLVDPIAFRVLGHPVRWYGISYVLAFAGAWVILRMLARRGRWPVAEDRVADVLFWGILGVFLGGRLGWVLFYGMHQAGWSWSSLLKVWEGGMSFHGGLLGVILAYWTYCARMGLRRGEFFDGLSLATTPGLFIVRLANFVNAELYGRVWDGPWAMRFPDYEHPAVRGPDHWVAGDPVRGPWLPDLRHPSQLYEALGEGILLFLALRWLMLRRGVGGGRIAAAFLIGYGLVRFAVEFTREPDAGIGYQAVGLTRGQELCAAMVLAGLVVLALCRRSPTPARPAALPPAAPPPAAPTSGGGGAPQA